MKHFQKKGEGERIPLNCTLDERKEKRNILHNDNKEIRGPKKGVWELLAEDRRRQHPFEDKRRRRDPSIC